MANVEFCAHDWPGSGCEKCRAEREKAKPGCEADAVPRDAVFEVADLQIVVDRGLVLAKRAVPGSIWALPGGFTS